MPEWLAQLHAEEDQEAEIQEPVSDQLEALTDSVGMEPAQREDESRAQEVSVEAAEPLEHVQEQAPEAVAVPADEEFEIQTYRDQIMAEPGTPQSRLAMARTHLRAGSLDDSALEYAELLESPEMNDVVIEDLEEIIETYPEHSALHRVLGDAYMRAGQLQKALVAYKEALAKI
jgi:cytochrome c-type biogenesis protein CcmH/NrfG